MNSKKLIIDYLEWEKKNPLLLLESFEWRAENFLSDYKPNGKAYVSSCTNEDGRHEILGYFNDEETANAESRKAENEPRNKKYGITFHVEEIDIE